MVLSYWMKRFDGENLFPQNEIDGQIATTSLNNLHLKAIRQLGFSFWLYLLTLASTLGHANLKMVSRYAHPSEQHKADAIRRVEKATIKRKTKAV
jgi:hypothetical protein